MRLPSGFGLLANAVTLFLIDPPTPQTNTLQMEKTFVLMTMLSSLIENQALEWQELSEEDGITSHVCGPKERYINHFKLQDSKRDGIENMEGMKQSRESKGNVFDSSRKTWFKKA